LAGSVISWSGPASTWGALLICSDGAS
jgi:hypothetical protein